MKKKKLKKMKKSVISKWFYLQGAQWNSIIWCGWLAICIAGMCLPVFSYPLQLFLTSFAKSLLSAIPPLAEWTVRHFSVYSDDMFFVACADCGRIFVISYVFLAAIEFIYAFILTYIKTDEKSSKKVVNQY